MVAATQDLVAQVLLRIFILHRLLLFQFLAHFPLQSSVLSLFSFVFYLNSTLPGDPFEVYPHTLEQEAIDIFKRFFAQNNPDAPKSLESDHKRAKISDPLPFDPSF